jgi:phosphoenolpyruvate---glycerone phosphotransferase subunit DhaL
VKPATPCRCHHSPQKKTPAIPGASGEHRDWADACQPRLEVRPSRCAGGELGCTLSVRGQGHDGPEEWDLDAIQATLGVVREMAAAMEENRRQLTKLDSEIGDGDHGNNMNRGFKAALERLEGADPSTPADVLKAVSMALISKVGGAAGPLYGTAFLRASTALGGNEEVSAEDAAGALEAALGGIKQRGKAEVGDKTIVDALEPAAEAAKGAAGEGSVAAVFRAAAEAAEEGVESTVPMTARRGRASYLGARAQGHQDPGATSTYLLLDAAARALEGAS